MTTADTTDSPPDPLPPGYRLGSYVIEGELPPATMGRVYKAVRTQWPETVAINVLAQSLRDAENMARFFECARRAYERHRVDERNQILDICDFPGITCVVLTYDERKPVLDVATE